MYKAIKAVQIKYTYSTSDFEVTDLGLNRVDKFMLEEVAVISENVIEFYVLRPG